MSSAFSAQNEEKSIQVAMWGWRVSVALCTYSEMIVSAWHSEYNSINKIKSHRTFV